MQETSQIGWDPMSIEYRPPWEHKIFVLYLILIVVVSLVKSASLTRQLWSIARVPLSKYGSAKERGRLLAASALSNGLPKQVSERDSGEGIAAPVLQEAESKFLVLWEACSAKVQSMKRLVVLTFLASLLVAAYRARTMLVLFFEKEFGVAAFSGGMGEVLMFFALGVLVCTVLYAACGFYEGVLQRRRESWNRLCERIRNQVPGA
jgi:hypothetical protein